MIPTKSFPHLKFARNESAQKETGKRTLRYLALNFLLETRPAEQFPADCFQSEVHAFQPSDLALVSGLQKKTRKTSYLNRSVSIFPVCIAPHSGWSCRFVEHFPSDRKLEGTKWQPEIWPQRPSTLLPLSLCIVERVELACWWWRGAELEMCFGGGRGNRKVLSSLNPFELQHYFAPQRQRREKRPCNSKRKIWQVWILCGLLFAVVRSHMSRITDVCRTAAEDGKSSVANNAQSFCCPRWPRQVYRYKSAHLVTKQPQLREYAHRIWPRLV